MVYSSCSYRIQHTVALHITTVKLFPVLIHQSVVHHVYKYAFNSDVSIVPAHPTTVLGRPLWCLRNTGEVLALYYIKLWFLPIERHQLSHSCRNIGE